MPVLLSNGKRPLASGAPAGGMQRITWPKPRLYLFRLKSRAIWWRNRDGFTTCSPRAQKAVDLNIWVRTPATRAECAICDGRAETRDALDEGVLTGANTNLECS